MKKVIPRVSVLPILAIACLLSVGASTFGQESAVPAGTKWRPKDGTYVGTGHDYNRCGDFGDIAIQLADNSIGGSEWSCKIRRLTDTSPSSIKLDMTCYDYNLAGFLNRPDETKFREVMLLKRIGDKAVSVRKTLNGKFEGPAWRADYCPDEAQRLYAEAGAKPKYKIPEQLLNPQQWRPRDGVYASPGANFDEHCAKSGDVIIGLADGSVSSSQGQCKVVGLMNIGQAYVSMDMDCPQASLGKKAEKAKKKNSDTPPENPGTEIIRMKKIDDNTFLLQKTQKRVFKDEGSPVAYCSEEIQRLHAVKETKN